MIGRWLRGLPGVPAPRRWTLRQASDLVPRIDRLPSRRRSRFPEIRDERFWSLYASAAPLSLLHVPGFYNLYQSMRYLAARRLPGDIVECGCFLGGVALFLGLLRRDLGLDDKRLVLFDTFVGPPVGSSDVAFGRPTTTLHALPHFRSEVEATLTRHLGGLDGIELVEGLVEDTVPVHGGGPICLLRLDTDHYPSTRVELTCLYPRLVPGGVLIVDDYGIYDGARRATDDFLVGLADPPLLNRIDGGIWAGVKP